MTLCPCAKFGSYFLFVIELWASFVGVSYQEDVFYLLVFFSSTF